MGRPSWVALNCDFPFSTFRYRGLSSAVAHCMAGTLRPVSTYSKSTDCATSGIEQITALSDHWHFHQFMQAGEIQFAVFLPIRKVSGCECTIPKLWRPPGRRSHLRPIAWNTVGRPATQHTRPTPRVQKLTPEQMSATMFMKEIFVDRKASAACLVSSAVLMLVNRIGQASG